MAAINYAKEYSRALAQAFPYVLNFGALYNTPNNGTYRWVNAKTIEIPSITTTGRVSASRDTIGTAQRNYDNAWETKTLSNQRKWRTLVHPMDIDQTNLVASISNITKTFNETQKFPEMDAYTVSKLYYDWTQQSMTADNTVLSTSNILSVFDNLMLKMDNARVPANGRVLYCTFEVKALLENASGIGRSLTVTDNNNTIDRRVNRLNEVEVVGVPATLMRSAYDFTEGYATAPGAAQINMFLVHPICVITPISYAFAQLDEPSAGSEGKYDYYEESFEDAFILNQRKDGLQFNISALNSLTVTSSAGTASGNTALTVSPSKATGNSYVYNVGTTAHALPSYGELLTGTDWTSWDGSSDITAATGKKLVLAEIDANGRAVGTGTATVTAHA